MIKVKVFIDKDEYYLFYNLYRSGKEVMISKEKRDWIDKVLVEFSKVQDYLEKLYGGDDEV